MDSFENSVMNDVHHDCSALDEVAGTVLRMQRHLQWNLDIEGTGGNGMSDFGIGYPGPAQVAGPSRIEHVVQLVLALDQRSAPDAHRVTAKGGLP